MNKACISLYLCLFFPLIHSWAQSPILSEDKLSDSLSDGQTFNNYLDTAYKYVYRDRKISNKSFEVCHRILDKGVDLADSLRLKFAIVQIYNCFAKSDPVCAFQIIVDNRHLTESPDVLRVQVSGFKYLESFTYMSLGDFEAAQKASYEGVTQAKEYKDTVSIINNLTGLGQLFVLSKDYEEALKYCSESLVYLKDSRVNQSTFALTYLDMSSIYSSLEEYDEAKLFLHKALAVIEKNEINELNSDIFSLLGKAHIALNQIDSAEYYYKKMQSYALDANNSYESLEAELYKAKRNYPKAIASYKKVEAGLDSSAVDAMLTNYEDIHETYTLMNKHEMAYEYLLKHQALKAKTDKDEKRQKTNYLRIKYETDEKIKDNAILKAQLYKRKAESNLLYGGLALAFVLLSGLFIALFQKARYSKMLEDKVSERTENLRESNEQLNTTNTELAKLNRILSHDLKEPIRSIVSFSELASRDEDSSMKTKEYLSHVTKSGLQLNQLIEDVNFLRESDSINSDPSNIHLEKLLHQVKDSLKSKYSDKTINLIYKGPESITGPRQELASVFRCLLDNSIKFNLHDNVQVIVHYYSENDQHLFEIKDNGIGIPQQFQDQVFGMFKRLNRRDKYGGSGLGLSIAKKMIEKIGGTISILKSGVNQGTIFSLSFPIK